MDGYEAGTIVTSKDANIYMPYPNTGAPTRPTVIKLGDRRWQPALAEITYMPGGHLAGIRQAEVLEGCIYTTRKSAFRAAVRLAAARKAHRRTRQHA